MLELLVIIGVALIFAIGIEADFQSREHGKHNSRSKEV